MLEDDINKFYIRYYLSSMCSKIEMDLSLSGTTIANLSLKTLSGINIVLPTNDEQIEIVSYLNEKCTNINKILGLKKQQLETLTQYKKSLIYEYVTGKKEVPT
ncbi:restriction endonuclease subunit S [bacterium]|nr:restriction endonuclease subunit S [bacterium]